MNLKPDETSLLLSIIESHDANLAQGLVRTRQVDSESADQVADILLTAFLSEIQPDSEPTPTGRKIDDLMGKICIAESEEGEIVYLHRSALSRAKGNQ